MEWPYLNSKLLKQGESSLGNLNAMLFNSSMYQPVDGINKPDT